MHDLKYVLSNENINEADYVSADNTAWNIEANTSAGVIPQLHGNMKIYSGSKYGYDSENVGNSGGI